MTKWLAIAMLGFAATAAQSATFNFNYVTGAGVQLTGSLLGTLQGDANMVIVTSIFNVKQAGVSAPALPFVVSNDFSNFGTSLLPKVTFNGLFMDINACDGVANCSGRGNALTFNAGNASAANFSSGNPFFAADGFFGAFAQPFVAARWSLVPGVSTVPVPASLPLLAAGSLMLIGFGLKIRRSPTRG